jgi:hypothetical protein
MSFVGPITEDFVNNVVKELSKEKNQAKIKDKVIDPLIRDVNRRYAPYGIALVGLLCWILYKQYNNGCCCGQKKAQENSS